MKLYLNDTSPFSRVVAATALLSGCKSLSFVWVDPWSSPDNLKMVNPFCLIPALELNDGTVITESLCICQYLIESYQPPTLQQVALSNGQQASQLGTAKTMMEIAFRTAALARFSDAEHVLIQRGKDGIKTALQRMNEEIDQQGVEHYCEPHLATLYLHVALDYIQFRHGSLMDEVPHHHILRLMHNSPFSSVLPKMSIESLSAKPSYADLFEQVSS